MDKEYLKERVKNLCKQQEKLKDMLIINNNKLTEIQKLNVSLQDEYCIISDDISDLCERLDKLGISEE